jgi:competence protein ComEA
MSRLVALLVALAFALGAETTTAWAQPPKEAPKRQPRAPAAKKESLDINSATEFQLQALPGISEMDAKKIVENRPYKTKGELVEKKVVPKATYDGIKDQIVAK